MSTWSAGDGGLYLVGEQGPELFSPGRDGMIHTAGDTERMLGAEPRSRTDFISSAAAVTPAAGGTVTVDASLHVGQVQFASPEDREEFEALLRRHSRAVADVVASETRRESRLSFGR